MIPLPDDSVLSHTLMSRFDEIINDTSRRATAFDHAIKEIGDILEHGQWAMGELCYWFDEFKLWKELSYEDAEGNIRKYESFVEYIKYSKSIPFAPAWVYVLKGIYKTYRYELRIGRDTPDLLEKLLNVGNFDKLQILRKVVNPQNVGHWLEVAAVLSKDELELTVDKAERQTQDLVKLPERVRIIPRKWQAKRLPVHNIRERTLAELIEDLELPDNAYVDIIVQIVDYGPEDEQDGDEENAENA